MELRTLHYFVAVAEEQSFSRAAQRCRVAQPAISQQIRGLEKEMGEPLFERLPRSVRLSPAGSALLPYAREALTAVAAAKAEFALRAGVLSGELALGSVDGVEVTALPALLGMFHRRFPAVSVRLSGGTSSVLLDRVRQGSLHAAAIAHPLEPLEASLGVRTVLEDEIVAVVPATHAAATRPSLPLETLGGETLISFGPESGLRPLIDSAFAAAGPAFRPAYETPDVALLVALAAEGIGIALAPGADPEIRQDARVAVLPVTPRIPYRKVLVWRRSPAPPAPLRALLSLPGYEGAPPRSGE
ncbi:LysR family transcriptional regulator [Actinoplanes sp. NPDC049548]|uniref:LysR family transcriptional regulator n=1 Tax=Actinoplanes sp. NPDC049548 TaxID=3155152 RepID=UPI00342538AD